MKIIIVALLVLLINIWNTIAVAAEMNFSYNNSHDSQLQVDRYTGYKSNATIEESNPLLVITQINFPSNIKTVYEAIDHALQRSGYRVDWQQSAEAYDIFSELEIPRVHRKLNLMTLKDAVATLSGEAWQLLIDSVNRKLLIQLHTNVSWQIANNPNSDDRYNPNPRYKESVPRIERSATTNNNRADSTMPIQAASINPNPRYKESVPRIERSAATNNNKTDSTMPIQAASINPNPRYKESVPRIERSVTTNNNRTDSTMPMQAASINPNLRYKESVPRIERSVTTNNNRADSTMSMQAASTNPNPRYKESVPRIERSVTTNNNRADSTMSMQAASIDFQNNNSGLALELPEAEVNAAVSDVLVNSIADNELAANELAAQAVYFEEAKMPTLDHADLYDEMPTIHRAQYTPGHIETHRAELLELENQTSHKRRSRARDLWSVQPIIKAKEGVGSLEEAVIVHYSSISVKELIEILMPEGWVVHYEVSDAILNQKLISHAESSRRNALSALFKELSLKALFYPGQAVVLVAEKEPRSLGYSNALQFNAIDSQNSHPPAESFSDTSEASSSQPEVDAILQNAKMIKNLMNTMEPSFK